MQRRRQSPGLSPKEARSPSSMLESVSIAPYRQVFFSPLSASLRAPRAKGSLVAAGRVESFWSFLSHPIHPAIPLPPVKNPPSGTVPMKVNEGQ